MNLQGHKGGVIGYNDLVRRYNGDDLGMFWEKRPPKTPVGVLRIHGLLFVGRIPKGERLRKMVIIPKEILRRFD